MEVIGGWEKAATSRRKDNGGSIWSNLNNRRRFIRRESEGQTDSRNGRLRRNRRGDGAVTGRAWRAGGGRGAGCDEGQSRDHASSKGRGSPRWEPGSG